VIDTAGIGRRRSLYFLLTLVMAGGFLAISLLSYHTSKKAIHESIVTSQLPLTSDNIYSEIQKDLIRPILISSLMAGDTFVRDWVLGGERDGVAMQRYLKEIMQRHGAFTSFFVSDVTRRYYHAESVLKQVSADEPRDRWYFRVRDMKEAYEINMDPDLANKDAPTIFINYRVFDYGGRFIGATGIGLTADAVQKRIVDYQQRYQRRIHFADSKGRIVLSSRPELVGKPLAEIDGLATLAPRILSGEQGHYEYTAGSQLVQLNARHIPELKWHLLVEQDEDASLADIRRSLYLNIAIVALVAGFSIWLTALTIGRYQRRLEEMAVTDKLTGIANRQAFAPLIEQLLSELRRSPQAVSLLLIDIDHFKQINDTHGHQAGDDMLRTLAQRIAGSLRESDLIFRWGGEEFLVVLRDCAGENARHLADKIRMAVAATPLAINGTSLHATISVGVAERTEDEDIDHLIGRADQALYLAKRDGRNCSRAV
jgi:diguanylate cyclase (GGDEF)-like protein